MPQNINENPSPLALVLVQRESHAAAGGQEPQGIAHHGAAAKTRDAEPFSLPNQETVDLRNPERSMEHSDLSHRTAEKSGEKLKVAKVSGQHQKAPSAFQPLGDRAGKGLPIRVGRRRIDEFIPVDDLRSESAPIAKTGV